MHIPYAMYDLAAAHREDLRRQAEEEQLARLACPPRHLLRSGLRRMSATLRPAGASAGISAVHITHRLLARLR